MEEVNPNTNNPPISKEICSAICAIVHAIIGEDDRFRTSRSRKISMIEFRKNCFSDNGVMVELEKDQINVNLYMTFGAGSLGLIEKSKDLQKKVFNEIIFFTGIKVKKVNVFITGIAET